MEKGNRKEDTQVHVPKKKTSKTKKERNKKAATRGEFGLELSSDER